MLFRSKVDFGEMDVLRDNSTGLIYIVDINPVAGGLVFKTMSNGDDAIKYLAQIYKTTYKL